jgi:hypothetical protein
MSKEDAVRERATRRGIQLFQIALEMEAGEAREGSRDVGAAALLSLANAIAQAATMTSEPRLALEVVVSLFDSIDASWFTKPHPRPGKVVSPKGDRLAEAALEMTLGQEDMRDVGKVAAGALAHLVDAIVYVAALNSEPRKILEAVVIAIHQANVDAARKEQRK